MAPSNPRGFQRVLTGAALLGGLNGLVILAAWLASRLVIPSWMKGPLIDPAAPYAPENALVLTAVSTCILLDIYVSGLFFVRRRWGRVRGAPIVLLLLGVLAAEGAMRGWIAVDSITYFRPHPTLHWQVRPNLHDFENNKDAGRISTNADGMRGVEAPRRKEPGEFRILVLGDSSNFGHGVEDDEMWSSALEDLLSSRSPDHPIRVLNGACPGWTTYQAIVFLDEIGLAYEPDLVIAGFNNDPTPDYLGDEQRLAPEAIRGINRWLWRSEVYLLARETVLATLRLFHPPAELPYSARLAGQEPKYGALTQDEAESLVPRVPLEQFLANLTALQEKGAEEGFELVWIDMPINRSLPDLMDRYVAPTYRQAAEELARDRGFLLVDVDGTFSRYPPGSLHIGGHVFHPNAVGHALMASQVADALTAAGMLPGITGEPGAASGASAPSPETLRIGISSFTPIHAHIAAVLRERPDLLPGTELELTLYASGATQGRAVAAGSLDAYLTCAVPAAHMLASFPPSTAVASPGELGRIALLARRDRAQKLEDLAGLRVGLVEGSTPAMVWEDWGATLDVEVVPSRTDELEEALLDGRIDAAVSWDPWVEAWQQRAPGELIVLAEQPFWSLLAVSEDWSRLEGASSEAVVAAMRQALKLAASDREHYDAVAAAMSGWDLPVVSAVADRNRFLGGRSDEPLAPNPAAADELGRSVRFALGSEADLGEFMIPALISTPPPPAEGSP